ncbi:TPA: hypothetical protein ACH3X1_013037 [Trebouxia sp. C0004]
MLRFASVQYVKVGIVGGSDEVKICEQLGANVCQNTSNDPDPNAAKDQVDFFFAENGLVAYKEGKILATESLKTWLGEDKLKELLNYILHYVADLDIPIKRGTFIEFRNGMLNVSPIGRNCSQEERDEFERFDQGAGVSSKHHHVPLFEEHSEGWFFRKTFIKALKKKFGHLGLTYSIGGQISFDIFPQGWDKTFCLQYVEKEYDEIHFFGDKTYEGGNDYEIFESPKTIGHTVNSPIDTIGQCRELFITPQQEALHGTTSH